MSNRFTYDDFSMQGLSNAFCEHFDVPMVDGSIKLDNHIARINMQSLTLPGDLEVVFLDYHYHENFIYEHIAGKEQRFGLWIDCSQTGSPNIKIDNKKIGNEGPKYNNAFLMNAIFPYKQLRTKGDIGKSVIIFLPPSFLEKFLLEKEDGSILGKFYMLQNERYFFLKLSEVEVKKIDSFFYQWNTHKNIFSIIKYTFQLMEWYFTKLSNSFGLLKRENTLSPQQAVDLYLLQKLINDSLSLPNIDFEGLDHGVITPVLELKKLFEKVHAKSIHVYFKESKIKNGMKLLTNTCKNISEIAYEIGYANPSNFSASFKKYYNITPQNYRKQLLVK